MGDSPQVPRDKYRSNRNVPIDGARLAAAIEFRALSVNATAKAAGEKQQTIQRITSGQTEKCRHARRLRLAEVLEVSDAWLGGEDVPPISDLPEGTVWKSGTDEYPLGHIIDENLRRLPEGAAVLPPAYQLYWSRLTQRVVDAWERDAEAGVTGAIHLAQWLGSMGESDPSAGLARLLQRMMGAVWWRSRLVLAPPFPLMPPDFDQMSADEQRALAERNEARMNAGRLTPDELDGFARRTSEAIEILIGPWLDGERELNYVAFQVALQWVRGGMQMGPLPELRTDPE